MQQKRKNSDPALPFTFEWYLKNCLLMGFVFNIIMIVLGGVSIAATGFMTYIAGVVGLVITLSISIGLTMVVIRASRQIKVALCWGFVVLIGLLAFATTTVVDFLVPVIGIAALFAVPTSLLYMVYHSIQQYEARPKRKVSI